MKLYDLDVSGNCYKVRLFAAFAKIDLHLHPVDFMNLEHQSDSMLELNSFAQLPVLQDENVTLRDSQAILVYLANKYGGEAWWPFEAHLQADVMQWLSVAANEIQHGPNLARLIIKFSVDADQEKALHDSHHILQLIDQHLLSHNWLAANRPTIAECAVVPYLALAHEGNVDISQYSNIVKWLNRVTDLPGFIPMPGLKFFN